MWVSLNSQGVVYYELFYRRRMQLVYGELCRRCKRVKYEWHLEVGVMKKDKSLWTNHFFISTEATLQCRNTFSHARDVQQGDLWGSILKVYAIDTIEVQREAVRHSAIWCCFIKITWADDDKVNNGIRWMAKFIGIELMKLEWRWYFMMRSCRQTPLLALSQQITVQVVTSPCHIQWLTSPSWVQTQLTTISSNIQVNVWMYQWQTSDVIF